MHLLIGGFKFGLKLLLVQAGLAKRSQRLELLGAAFAVLSK